MDLWNIFVLTMLRVNLNLDYDRLQNLANEHRTIRAFLGHGSFNDEYQYPLQTIKDNLELLTPEILMEINEIIVHAGHGLLSKKKSKSWKCVRIASLSKRTCTTRQTLIYYGMPSEKSFA